MHEAAKLRPVVVDEALTDLESLLLAREMGYTGRRAQSLQGTEPGDAHGGGRSETRDVSLRTGSDVSGGVAHSLGGHRRARTRQRRNRSECAPVRACGESQWEARFPGLFTIRDGVMRTGQLVGAGLGAVTNE